MKNPSKGGKIFGKEKFLAEIFLMTENQLLLRLYQEKRDSLIMSNIDIYTL